jgi:FAD/FMN-containing dehydrogenase
MPYPKIYTLFGPGEDEHPPQEVARTIFLNRFDHAAAETLVEHLQRAQAFAVAQLRVLGGAMARVPADATAFAHRDRRFMAAIGAVYEDAAETPKHLAWLTDYIAALHDGTSGAYVNFLGDEGEARVREAYPGTTWDRLTAIKARYDPTNLFRLNQNIPPATDGAK